jgi:hypothetical protein
LENADRRRVKSHLPCAGIILFRFYGYYLSLAFPLSCGTGQHPGNLIYRFSAGKAKICNIGFPYASNKIKLNATCRVSCCLFLVLFI